MPPPAAPSGTPPAYRIPDVKPDNAPRWATGFALLLTSIVGALLASEGIIDKVLNRDSIRAELAEMTAHAQTASQEVAELKESLEDFSTQLSTAREKAAIEVATLKAQLAAKDDTIDEMKDRETKLMDRVETLERQIAQLTDGKLNSVK